MEFGLGRYIRLDAMCKWMVTEVMKDQKDICSIPSETSLKTEEAVIVSDKKRKEDFTYVVETESVEKRESNAGVLSEVPDREGFRARRSALTRSQFQRTEEYPFALATRPPYTLGSQSGKVVG